MPLSILQMKHLEIKSLAMDENFRNAPTTRRSTGVAVKSWYRYAGNVIPNVRLVHLYIVQELDKRRKISGILTYVRQIFSHYRNKKNSVFDGAGIMHSAVIKRKVNQARMKERRAGVFTKRASIIEERAVRKIAEKVTNYDSLLFAAIVVCLFFNIGRASEYVLPAHKKSQSVRKLPLLYGVRSTPSRTSLAIRSQKNDQYRRHDLVLNNKNAPSWARKILHEYYVARTSNTYGLRQLPEFFVRKDGSIPTSNWLGDQLKLHIGSSSTIHGLRAGGTMYMALRGRSVHAIKMAGRWRSDAFMSYIQGYPALYAILERGLRLSRR